MSNQTSGFVSILRRTRPWVRLASTVGFLLAGLMAFLAADAMLGIISPRRPDPFSILLIDVVGFVVFLIPSVQLHEFSSRIRTFVMQGHNVQLEAALEAQRRFWRVAGVVLIACAVFLVAGVALLVIRAWR